MRKQDIRSRYVDGQNCPQRIPVLDAKLVCERDRVINQPTLTGDAEGVENHEGVVAQPESGEKIVRSQVVQMLVMKDGDVLTMSTASVRQPQKG